MLGEYFLLWKGGDKTFVVLTCVEPRTFVTNPNFLFGGITMYFEIANLAENFNPFNQMSANAPRYADTKQLEKSIKASSYWDNSLVGIHADTPIPEGKKTLQEWIDFIETLPVEDQLDITSKYPFKIANGHRRILAAKRCGIKTANLKVIVANDEMFLYLLAEENNETYGGSISTTIESVRMAKDLLIEQTSSVRSFDEYKAAGYTAVKTEKSFKNILSQGVGYRSVATFLKWPQNLVRNAFNVLDLVSIVGPDGLDGFTSMDQAAKFSLLVEKVSGATHLHPAFIDKLIADCADVVLNDAPSGKTINGAAREFENGNNPVPYLKSMKISPLEKTLRSWIKDQLREDANLEGDEKFMALVDEVRGDLEKQVDREQREAQAEAEREAAINKTMEEEGVTREEAVQKVGEPALFGEEDDGESSDNQTAGPAPSKRLLITAAVAQIRTTFPSLGQLGEVADEIDPDDTPAAFTALEELLATTTKVMVRTHGLKKVRAIVTEASK